MNGARFTISKHNKQKISYYQEPFTEKRMGSSNPFGGDGSSINRPPIFSGEGYAYWKVRMQIFIEANF
ncbi:hypothetical protein Lal_00043413 [Lupinus albus]|nr:hypothetical protein Lal_00043413 [Lupinus albus]